MSRVDFKAQRITPEAFAPFGDVLGPFGQPDKMINAGLCGRYHDVAALDFSDGRAGISVFHAEPRAFPYTLDLMERHPDGSQAFIPMHRKPFLVTVAPDEDGRPGTPLAFVTEPGRGVNFHRNVWHGVLTPLQHPGVFAVVDRIGEGANLEEFQFEQAFTVIRENRK